MSKVSNLEDKLMDIVHNEVYTSLTKGINLLGKELLVIPMGEERRNNVMKTAAERVKRVFCTYVDGLVDVWSCFFKVDEILEETPLKFLKKRLFRENEDKI